MNDGIWCELIVCAFHRHSLRIMRFWGKGERWKRNLLSPSPLGRPDTQASTGTVLVSIRWGLHVVNRTQTSCYFSWKRCWLVFSYHGEFSRFQVSKYIEYSAYTGCISLYIYCLITCNIKSLLNVPKISHISRKISQVSRFPAKSPDSRNKFVFLPKQPLLELSPPVKIRARIRFFIWTRNYNSFSVVIRGNAEWQVPCWQNEI